MKPFRDGSLACRTPKMRADSPSPIDLLSPWEFDLLARTAKGD